MGIVSNRQSAADYDTDMKAAKAAGIDAFALNIGTDTYTHDQLTYAYESAASNSMSVFISFDFAHFKVDQISEVAALINEFGDKPGQLKIGNKIFVSSFIGDQLNVQALRDALPGKEIYFAPNFAPYLGTDSAQLDGAL